LFGLFPAIGSGYRSPEVNVSLGPWTYFLQEQSPWRRLWKVLLMHEPVVGCGSKPVCNQIEFPVGVVSHIVRPFVGVSPGTAEMEKTGRVAPSSQIKQSGGNLAGLKEDCSSLFVLVRDW